MPILFVTTLVSCASKTRKQEDKNPYFEGFVEFTVSYSVDNAAYLRHLKQNFGARAVTYIGKDGFFCREYIDSNNIIIQRQIYRPDSLRFYVNENGGDTINSQDVTRPESNTVYMGLVKNNPFKILNHNVEAVQTRTIMLLRNNKSSTIDATYYNDTNYPVNPLTYKYAVYEKAEEMFSHSPYVTAGYHFEYGGKASVTVTATRIVPSPVPSWHFEIPQHKTIVYQNQ